MVLPEVPRLLADVQLALGAAILRGPVGVLPVCSVYPSSCADPLHAGLGLAGLLHALES